MLLLSLSHYLSNDGARGDAKVLEPREDPNNDKNVRKLSANKDKRRKRRLLDENKGETELTMNLPANLSSQLQYRVGPVPTTSNSWLLIIAADFWSPA